MDQEKEILLQKLLAIEDEIELNELRNQKQNPSMYGNFESEDEQDRDSEQEHEQTSELDEETNERVDRVKFKLMLVKNELKESQRTLKRSQYVEQQITLENQKLVIQMELLKLENQQVKRMFIIKTQEYGRNIEEDRSSLEESEQCQRTQVSDLQMQLACFQQLNEKLEVISAQRVQEYRQEFDIQGKQLQEKLRDYKESNHQLKQAIDVLKSSIQRLQEDNDAHIKQKLKLKDKIQALKSQIQVNENSIQILKAEQQSYLTLSRNQSVPAQAEQEVNISMMELDQEYQGQQFPPYQTCVFNNDTDEFYQNQAQETNFMPSYDPPEVIQIYEPDKIQIYDREQSLKLNLQHESKSCQGKHEFTENEKDVKLELTQIKEQLNMLLKLQQESATPRCQTVRHSVNKDNLETSLEEHPHHVRAITRVNANQLFRMTSGKPKLIHDDTQTNVEPMSYTENQTQDVKMPSPVKTLSRLNKLEGQKVTQTKTGNQNAHKQAKKIIPKSLHFTGLFSSTSSPFLINPLLIQSIPKQ